MLVRVCVHVENPDDVATLAHATFHEPCYVNREEGVLDLRGPGMWSWCKTLPHCQIIITDDETDGNASGLPQKNGPFTVGRYAKISDGEYPQFADEAEPFLRVPTAAELPEVLALLEK